MKNVGKNLKGDKKERKKDKNIYINYFAFLNKKLRNTMPTSHASSIYQNKLCYVLQEQTTTEIKIEMSKKEINSKEERIQASSYDGKYF